MKRYKPMEKPRRGFNITEAINYRKEDGFDLYKLSVDSNRPIMNMWDLGTLR